MTEPQDQPKKKSKKEKKKKQKKEVCERKLSKIQNDKQITQMFAVAKKKLFFLLLQGTLTRFQVQCWGPF